ncbi:MAG: gamma-glutamyl:cysteine ligase YbdK (ATP-grasp superfamily) [Glaciecola sp.]|jgi:gamma-glutamyl:cysteine ligase YbdK (ATP-grasp superfamily)
MGQDIDDVTFTREDRAKYREKVKACLAVLRRMLDEDHFEVERKLVGVEVELCIVDDDGQPVNINAELLALMESEDFQTELAQFNIEFNLAPHKLVGRVFREIEEELETAFQHATAKARQLDANAVMIGILPTLDDLHIQLDNISANPRYSMLNDQILEARGEDLTFDIEGAERLTLTANSIMMEAAATSVQLHLQVSPDGFASVWNTAQAISAPQVALGANSPWLLGKQLWHETRIAAFAQSIDTRTEELTAQGVRPRVWFGEKWIDSITDLFDENVKYFPALLPLLDEEDPEAVLDRGDIPHLGELNLHNGTIYRWNRPIYGVARGKPHLRVENRVLPAGPTVVDTLANAAFYYGLVRAVTQMDEPITRSMSFHAAEENFNAAARDGIEAQLFWPGLGRVPASELVLRTLLPLAAEGLSGWEVNSRDRDNYLGIIEQRALHRRNGATWQIGTVRKLEAGGMDRRAALAQMTRRYLAHQLTNEPVHTWELG